MENGLSSAKQQNHAQIHITHQFGEKTLHKVYTQQWMANQYSVSKHDGGSSTMLVNHVVTIDWLPKMLGLG